MLLLLVVSSVVGAARIHVVAILQRERRIDVRCALDAFPSMADSWRSSLYVCALYAPHSYHDARNAMDNQIHRNDLELMFRCGAVVVRTSDTFGCIGIRRIAQTHAHLTDFVFTILNTFDSVVCKSIGNDICPQIIGEEKHEIEHSCYPWVVAVARTRRKTEEYGLFDSGDSGRRGARAPNYHMLLSLSFSYVIRTTEYDTTLTKKWVVVLWRKSRENVWKENSEVVNLFSKAYCETIKVCSPISTDLSSWIFFVAKQFHTVFTTNILEGVLTLRLHIRSLYPYWREYVFNKWWKIFIGTGS